MASFRSFVSFLLEKEVTLKLGKLDVVTRPPGLIPPGKGGHVEAAPPGAAPAARSVSFLLEKEVTLKPLRQSRVPGSMGSHSSWKRRSR